MTETGQPDRANVVFLDIKGVQARLALANLPASEWHVRELFRCGVFGVLTSRGYRVADSALEAYIAGVAERSFGKNVVKSEAPKRPKQPESRLPKPRRPKRDQGTKKQKKPVFSRASAHILDFPERVDLVAEEGLEPPTRGL